MAVTTFKAFTPKEQHFVFKRDHIHTIIIKLPKSCWKSLSSPVKAYQRWPHLTKNLTAIPLRG